MRFLSFCSIAAVLLVQSACSPVSNRALFKDLNIVSREEWGSGDAVLPMKKHVPNVITVHHTATKQNRDKTLSEKLKGLQKFSIERSTLGSGKIKEPWADIPYHFYITANGEIGEGRELQYAGDSNTPYDPTGHALIVLEGNFQNEAVPAAQYESLKKLTIALAKRYKISADQISGHKDNADTLCPGEALYQMLPQLKTDVGSAL